MHKVEPSTERHQRKLLKIVLAVVFVCSLIIGGLNLLLFSAWQVASFNFISAALSGMIWIYFQYSRNLQMASWFLVSAVLFNLMMFVVPAQGAAYSVIWLTVLPPLAFFLLGKHAGSWVTGLAFAATIFFLLTLPESSSSDFSTGAILNIIEVFIVLWLMFRFYEGSRAEAYQELERISERDKLTGLYNRAKLDDLLMANIQLAARTRMPLVVMIIDIDHFKRVNDQHGHLRGDEILKSMATVLRQAVRVTDVIGRWGGEEFLLLCPATELTDGVQLAGKLREQAEQRVRIGLEPVTLSFGLTCVTESVSPELVIQQADDALYAAKRNGRNRVEAYLDE